MQAIQNGYNGLSLLVALNFDRIVMAVAIIVGLVGGAMIGAHLIEMQPLDAPSVH